MEITDHDMEEAWDGFVTERLSRGQLVRRAAALGVGAAALPTLFGADAFAAPPTNGHQIALADLMAKAKKEGAINIIACPPTWANYGEIMSTYKSKFKVKLSDAIPDGTSAQENQAILSQKGSSRAPDVVDVGPSFAVLGKKQKLYTPYKSSNFATVPAKMKDAQGYWVGDYWGVIGFQVNTDIVHTVPKDWGDLKSSAYHNMIALGGSPLQAGEAFAAVFAASLANGGSLDDILPGIQFFSDLKKSGNFITVQATAATAANGQTPIVAGWDYLALANRDTNKGKVNFQIQVPKTGVFGNFYAQAISKYAPHPYNARLWQEFLYSDAGQLLWLKGYTHPARFDDMAKRKAIPSSLLKRLPPSAAYANVKFPNEAQTTKATAVLQQNWNTMVGG